MRLHLPSILGRARADRIPLLLTALVILVAVLIAAAVPPLIDSAADDAVRDSVVRSGSRAELLVTSSYDPESYGYPRRRIPESAEYATDATERARGRLDLLLGEVFDQPVTTVSSGDLNVVTGNRPGRTRTLRLVYADSEPGGFAGYSDYGVRVIWLDGEPPGPTGRGPRQSAEPWPVNVALSEATAARLEVGTGDRIATVDSGKLPVELVVSGIYRPEVPGDKVWRAEPQLVEPRVVTDTRGIETSSMAVLMSAESLPDGRLATDQTDITVRTRFLPEPDEVTRDNAAAVADSVLALKAGIGGSEDSGTPLKFSSGLDTLLKRVLGQISVAVALAWVLLGAVLAGVALALLLTAELLTRRRASVLTSTRRRGAGLPGIAAELAVESIVVTLVAGAGGVLLARLLTGEIALGWTVPVLVVAVVAAPGSGVLTAARATTGRAAPANRSARRNLRLTQHLRRITVEAAIVSAAAGAYAALAQRGVATQDGLATTLLPALAPTLVAIAGGVLVLRVIPPLLRGLVSWSTRLPGSLPLLSAARAAATAARPLPVVLVVMAVALSGFALSVRATASAASKGQATEDALPEALADGLRDLAATSSLVLVLLALLAVVLGAAAGAPDRGETLARLRTLGLPRAATRRIALGELLPVALIGGLTGWLVGWGLAHQAVGLLSLGLLNGRPDDPALVVPVATALPVGLLVVAVVGVVAIESSLRRRERLGQVLRA